MIKKKMLLIALALLSVAGIKSAENDYRGGYATEQPQSTPPNPAIQANLLTEDQPDQTPDQTYNSQLQKIKSWKEDQPDQMSNEDQPAPTYNSQRIIQMPWWNEQQSNNPCPAQNFSKKVYHPGDVVACAYIPGSNGTLVPPDQTYTTFSSKSKDIVIGTGGGGMPGAGSYITITVNPTFNGKKKTVTITEKTTQGFSPKVINTKKYTITVAPRPHGIKAGSHGAAKTKNTGQVAERRALTNEYDTEVSSKNQIGF